MEKLSYLNFYLYITLNKPDYKHFTIKKMKVNAHWMVKHFILKMFKKLF